MQVHECARIAMSNIENDIERYEMIDINKLVKSFTLDSIAKITCSVKVDSYQNWDSEFRKIADSSFNVNIVNLAFMFPWIFSKLNKSILNPEFIAYFKNLTKTILDQRKKDGTSECYNDVLAIMSRVRSGQKIDDAVDSNIVSQTQINKDIISKTIMQFYFDGYDTTKNLILPIIYLLSLNPQAQVIETIMSEIYKLPYST